MKQGNKIVSYVVVLSIFFVITQTAGLLGLFHVAFKSVEKVIACKNLQFCINSLQAELKHLGGVAFEWSAWEDTSLYIKGEKPQYIGENMGDSTLREKNLDVICILDNSGKLIWGRFVKYSGNEYKKIELDLFSPENLKKNTALWNHKDVNSNISGYYSTEGGVLMLSSRPVTNNTNSPPINGTIIIGRFVTDRMIASIASQTCLDFKWWNLNSDYTRQAINRYASQITPDNPVYTEFELNSTAAYTILRDINNKDAVLVKFLMTDDLAPYRDELMIKSAGILFGEGFLLLLCLAFLTNSYCAKHFSEAQTRDTLLNTEDLPQKQLSQLQYNDQNTVWINK